MELLNFLVNSQNLLSIYRVPSPVLGRVGDTAETETAPGSPLLRFTVQWGTHLFIVRDDLNWTGLGESMGIEGPSGGT